MIFSLFVSIALFGETDTDKQQQRFIASLDKLRKMVRIPGLSYAVIHKGKLVLSGGLGKQDLAKNIRATAQTKYPIASLTKLFTANLFLQLEAEGKVNLHSPVSSIVTRYKLNLYLTNLNNLSLVEILSHRHDSGGTFFCYNPTSYHELTPLIEKITGVSFATSLQRRFFLPLGMSSTFPGLSEAYYSNKAAVCYRLQKKSGFLPTNRGDAGFSGAYGIVSSVADLAKYEIALQKNEIASSKMQQQLFNSAFGKGIGQSGLSWLLDSYLGEKISYHYGWRINCASALYLRVPSKNLAFILLANSEMLSAPFGLSYGSISNSPFALLFLRTFLEGRRNGLVGFDKPSRLISPFLYKTDLDGDKTARYYSVAKALLEQYRGRWQESMITMETVLNRYPYDPALAGYGNLIYAMQNQSPFLTVAAKRMLFYLRGLSPKNPRLLYYNGLWLYRDEQIVESMVYFEKVANNLAAPPVMRSYSGYFVGMFNLKDKIKASKYLKMALNIGALSEKDYEIAFLKWIKLSPIK